MDDMIDRLMLQKAGLPFTVYGLRFKIFCSELLHRKPEIISGKLKLQCCPLLFIVCFLTVVRAQDIHFSQYNTSPLLLNPALTGFYSGDYRIAGIFRSQWGSFGDSYRTIAVSFEGSVLKGKLKNDYVGIGLQFFNDKAGEVELGANCLALSAAYRKAMGYRKKQALMLGVQAAVMKQQLNTGKLIFDSQYNGIIADPSAASGEAISGSSNAALDLNVGLLYHAIPGSAFNFYIGGAYYHLLEPKISFLAGSAYRMSARYAGHMGAKIELSRLLNLLPSAVCYMQGRAWQVNAGTYLQFVLNDDDYESLTAFSLGAWTRVATPLPDAVIIGARMDYWDFVLTLSYDVNISDLRTVSQSRGAYEVSMIYIGKFVTRGQRRLMVPCPQL